MYEVSCLHVRSAVFYSSLFAYLVAVVHTAVAPVVDTAVTKTGLAFCVLTVEDGGYSRSASLHVRSPGGRHHWCLHAPGRETEATCVFVVSYHVIPYRVVCFFVSRHHIPNRVIFGHFFGVFMYLLPVVTRNVFFFEFFFVFVPFFVDWLFFCSPGMFLPIYLCVPF